MSAFNSSGGLGCCRSADPSGAGSPPQLSSLGHQPYARILDGQQETPVAVFRPVTIYALKLYRKKSLWKVRDRQGRRLAMEPQRTVIISGQKSSRGFPFSSFEVGVIGLPAKDLLRKCKPSLTFVWALVHVPVLFLQGPCHFCPG